MVLTAAAGFTLGGGAAHASATTSIWLQTIDSCKLALGGAEYQIVDTAGTFNVTVTTPPQSSLHTLSSSNTCPLQRGNCATVNYGCVQVTGLPVSDTFTIHEIATPPPNTGNPLGYAPCNGGSACRSQSDSASTDAGGAVTASTTNVYPDATTNVYPSTGTFAGTAADPIIFHDFGLGSGNCDGDSDADDQLTGGNSPHCAYPEDSEASAFQPYPWSSSVTESANHFVLSVPGSVSAGTPFNATITAFDPGNDAATNYTSTENLVWSGPTHAPNGAKPSYPASANFTSGVATVSITLFNVQTTPLTVVQGSLSGTATGMNVGPGATTQFTMSTPGTQTANKPFSVKLTAKDTWSNPTPAYAGNVALTWSGPSKSPNGTLPTYPSTVPFSSGVGNATITLFDAQSTSVGATDGTAKGKTNTFTVNPATASPGGKLSLTNPSGSVATAGTPFNETVTALDPYGNVATSYASASLTWSGPSNGPNGTPPSYPPNPVAFTNGIATVSITLYAVQKTVLNVTDGVLTGVSGTITVSTASGGTADHFVLSTPGLKTAGQAFNESVTAVDASGNTVKSYSGHPTISGPLPSPNGTAPYYSPSALSFSNGVATVSITIYNAATTSLTVSDGTISTSTGTFTVRAAAYGFSFSSPGAPTAGVPFNDTITVQDAYGNVSTGYSHHPTITGPSPAPNGTAPKYSVLNFASGVATATITLYDAQNTSLSLVDGTMVGSSATFTVNPATFAFSLITPTPSPIAGQAFNETVTVRDAYGNTNYAGTATIFGLHTSPGGNIPTYAPNPLSFTNGSATVAITPFDAETTSLTVSDGTISASTATFTVQPGAFGFSLTNPGTQTAGLSFSVTATVQDTYGNVNSGYSGVPTFSGPSPSPNNTPPTYGALSFSSGNAAASVTLYDAQTTSLTLSDGSGTTGTTAPFIVNPAQGAFTFSQANPGVQTAGQAFSETITAQDGYANVFTDYSGTPIITGPDPSLRNDAPQYSGLAFANGTATVSITLFAAETTSLTVSDSGSGLTSGTTGTFTVSPGTTNTSGDGSQAFTVSVQSASPVGNAVPVTVFAVDAWGNTSNLDNSTLVISTSDAAAGLNPTNPTAIALAGGTVQFQYTFATPGSQSISVSTSSDDETGQSGSGSGSTTVQ